MSQLTFKIATAWLLCASATAWGDSYRVDVSNTLTVRASPAASATALGSVKRHAIVDVKRFVGNTQTIGGKRGKWAEIAYASGTAYVFGGFLSATDSTGSTSGDSDADIPVVAPHADVLQRLADKFPTYYANGVFLVDDSDQRMYWYKDGSLVKTFRISTAAKGLGAKADSNQTPPGAHRIVTKIGKTAPRGMIFDKLTPTGEIAKIYTKPQYGVKALVTSRILRLEGLEPGKNKGGSVDTFNRAIYFHGTNKEGNLGTRASHGCIRMKNDEIIDLFNRVSVDTLVYIQP